MHSVNICDLAILLIEPSNTQDGKQGADLFAQDQEAFDLIPTDLNMPIMDGQAMIAFIRNELGNAIIPILR